MKTLKIFEHKGVIGAQSNIETGTFLNDPTGAGQLGVVVAVEHAQITQGAKQILLDCPRDGGSFAPIMLTTARDGSGYSVALMGARKHMMPDPTIGRTCDREVLNRIEVVDFEIDPEFIHAVERYLGTRE